MEKRRKKHHPIRNLFIVLGIIVLVVVLPVGALFLLVYDKTENTRVYDSTNITEMGSKALVTGIRSTKQKQKISVEVSKDDLNGVIVDMTSNLNIEQIKKIYALKEDNNINFYMELEAGPMRSLVTLKTAIVDETDNLEMNIEEVLIGKLKVSKSLANNVFKMFGVKLEAQETNGVTIDFTNWKVILSKDLLLDSLKNGDELISDIFDIIDKNELLTFNTTDPNSIISVDINIDKFKLNPLLTPDDEHLFTNAPSTPYAIMGVDQVSSEIDSKVYYIIKHANITSAQLQPLFEFLFTGYKYSSDANKKVVEAIKTQNPHIFEEVGISDLSTYKSLGDELVDNSGSLLGNAEAQINFTDLSQQDIAAISESDVNRYIRGKGVIGYTGVVPFEEDGKVTDYAFFTIDNFYCNIVDDHIYFVCGLNICGFETNIVFSTEMDNTQADKSKAYFRLSKVEYGEIDGGDLKDTLFSIIEGGLGEDEMFGVDKEKSLIYFNLQPVVDKVKEFDGYKDKTAADIVLTAIGDGLADDGQLKLSIR